MADPIFFRHRALAACEAAVRERVFPGSVVGYVHGGERQVLAYGRLTYTRDAAEVTRETLYDVASITKSVPTSSLALKLIEDGKLRLDDRVVDYIPELSMPDCEQITIRHLLTYTIVFDLPDGLSGLVAQEGVNFLPQLFRTPLTARPGERYFYTNPPALLLGMVIEKIGGAPLEQLAQETFFGPLRMTRSSFDVSHESKALVAPTEIVEGWEIRGVVHDETARVMAGQDHYTGIAGLFSTADDLLRFAEMLVNEGEFNGRRYFKPETILEMSRNQLAGIGEHTGLGWEVDRPDVMGAAARPHLLIKSGHTGCLIVIDLERKAALVHLSNRTYPQRGDRTALRAFWRNLNEAFLDELKAT